MNIPRFSFLPKPKKITVRVLQWELPLIMLWSVILLVSLQRDAQTDPVGAYFSFAYAMESVSVSLVLSAFTAFLADLLAREAEKKDR